MACNPVAAPAPPRPPTPTPPPHTHTLATLRHPLLPAPFLQINSTRLPYATILQRSKQELLVFKCILAAAVVAVVAALWRSFGRVALAALGLA